jgi:hypothetical protein
MKNLIDNAPMIACLLILFGLVAAGSAGAGQPPVLQDQYGDSGSLSDYPGEPVLAIVTSARKLRWIGKWEETIRPELPELVSIRIADVTDQPRPGYEEVAKKLRQRIPEGVSVLIDIQNFWASAYELDTDEPCLLLFDSDHNVVATFRGRPKGKLVDAVMVALREYFSVAVDS